MPRRSDLRSICVLGSGPVVIGQAAEFDYSGTQAVKALKDEGYYVILINSNPATIMTNSTLADRTYIEPLSLGYVEEILRTERPQALLSTVGGQTALNLACALYKKGVLDELGIELIGADISAIEKAEDRQKFKEVMQQAGLPVLRSHICKTMEEAKKALLEFGLPLVIRPSFTLGGAGGGIVFSPEEFGEMIEQGFYFSPTHEVLIEESVLGWKEYEFEVIRDEADNAVVVCSIENFDPMGVHTGDSITVAPAQTLSDVEYQKLRDASLLTLRAIGVKTGGSNVQFAVNPKDGRMVVIEMNPRVSRSSALASKATGYPIAKVAAKLAVGYRLDELTNEITQKTKAAFEPALDYVVVKIPRFSFEKFQNQEPTLTTQMRSVGEIMAMGRTFCEAFHKAISSLELGTLGLDSGILGQDLLESQHLDTYLKTPTPLRPWKIALALRQGYGVEEITQSTHIDPWFLEQIKSLVDCEKKLTEQTIQSIDQALLFEAKQMGFSDHRLSELLKTDEKSVRQKRLFDAITPCFKRVDTCAGEFLAHTPYLYSTYERPLKTLFENEYFENGHCEAKVTQNQKVIVLGSGPIRIGQGIEFDCCCVEAISGLRSLGLESIMINCNPETVSTDFDCSDRLYFEPLTFEHVMNIVEIEKPLGVIVQLGGQTPLKLVHHLEEAGVRILGTQAKAIDTAEDRGLSQKLIQSLGLRQPASVAIKTMKEACAGAQSLGYPLMVRPSYVLGGRAMERVYNEAELKHYMEKALQVSLEHPILIDRFLDGAMEIDVDALSDGVHCYIAGILQHIEEAGIHSGDSACVLPPYDLSPALIQEIESATKAICRSLPAIGLVNIQFAIKDFALYVLEINPRASRTVPFVSKVTGVPLAQLAAQIMCGAPWPSALKGKSFAHFIRPDQVAVKAPVMPFSKFPKTDPLLGPEMRSTGEVMGLADRFPLAFMKSQIGAGVKLPLSGTVLVSVTDRDKEAIFPSIRRLYECGFRILATAGTHWFLKAHQIDSIKINKVREGSPHVLEYLDRNEVDLMLNTTLGSKSVYDSHLFRKKAMSKNIPYYTSISAAKAVSQAIEHLQKQDLNRVMPMQERVPPFEDGVRALIVNDVT